MSQFKFDTGLSIDHAHHWGVWEGVREFVQNMLDQDNYECDFIHHDDGTLSLELVNRNADISREIFVIGKSSKKEDDLTIGKYGEGIKVAIPVLLRLGLGVTIRGNTYSYVPSVEESLVFGCSTVHITEYTLATAQQSTNVAVTITGLTKEDAELIVRNVLPFREELNIHYTSLGSILLDKSEAGRVYVGGIYVCYEDALTNGYSINPKEISLDRDRSLARRYDITSITTDMWHEVNIPTVTASMIVDGVADIEFSEYRQSVMGSSVPDLVYSSLQTKYGDDVVLAQTTEDAVKMRAFGYGNVTVIPKSTTIKIAQSSKQYKQVLMNTVVKSPLDALYEFKTIYLQDANPALIKAFDSLVLLLSKFLK